MKNSRMIVVFSAAAALTAGLAIAPVPAYAADPVMAPAEKSPWMIRVRAIGVIPDEDASVAIGGVPVVGGDVSVDDSFVPELDITYFLTDNIALELVLATMQHDAKGAGVLAGIGLGDVWLLPPTLTLQYHFTGMGNIKPYVGVGVNYTIFYSADSGPLFTSISYDDEFGFALQAGVDIMLDEHWGINFDVKKIFLNTDVTTISPILGVVTADVDIDPWVVGGGVVYRF